jgi:hypothetical protein
LFIVHRYVVSQQELKWAFSISLSSGSFSLQMSITDGHRVENLQPEGSS